MPKQMEFFCLSIHHKCCHTILRYKKKTFFFICVLGFLLKPKFHLTGQFRYCYCFRRAAPNIETKKKQPKKNLRKRIDIDKNEQNKYDIRFLFCFALRRQQLITYHSLCVT